MNSKLEEIEESRIKVSVVIPVYNTADFVSECLDSVLHQSLKEIEIIVVDDCSTDNSLDLLKIYEAQDSRLSIVQHATNKGLPETRNSGVQRARGEFVIHVDSDDFWRDQTMLEQLYELAEVRQSDVIKFTGHNYIDGQLGSSLSHVVPVQNTVLEDEKSLWNFRSTFLYFCRRSVILKNRIEFDSNINIGEDQIYVAKILSSAKRISTIDLPFYAYRVNSQSMMRKKWGAHQFAEEVSHSEAVGRTLQHMPLIHSHYMATKLNYWWRSIFPRAFEDLDKVDRLNFFSLAIDFHAKHILACELEWQDLNKQAHSFSAMLSKSDPLEIENNFREKINAKFSPFCGTNLTKWPTATLNQYWPERPSREIRGTVIVHSGTHKTGSTAIQEFLAENEDQLKSDGIFYCSVANDAWGPNSHLLPVSLVDQEQHLLGWPELDEERIWDSILKEYQESGCEHLLLSSEFFSPEFLKDELPNLAKLKRLLGNNRVRFVFYVRAQDSRIESGYAQLIHSGVRAVSDTFTEFVDKTLSAHDYGWLLGEYEQHFGKEAITVNRYHLEDFPQGNICRDFLKVLELDDSEYFFSSSSKNETWSDDVIDFLQQANRFDGNYLSIAQRDRISHYFRHWFRKRNYVETASASRFSDSLHSQVRAYFEASNLAFSRKYLPKDKPVEIYPRVPSGHVGNCDQEVDGSLLSLPTLPMTMLLDTWAEKDKLEQQVRFWKSQSTSPRFRELLPIAKKKLSSRLSADFKQVKEKISRLIRLVLATSAIGLRSTRRFSNLEKEDAFNFYLKSSHKKVGVSAMLRVKNEEVRIAACLQSMYELFDEIVLIDNGSTDRTLEIAQEFILKHDQSEKIRIEKYPFTVSRCGTENEATPQNSVHSLAYYYNWCLSKCQYTYVCKWDADMLLSPLNSPSRKLQNFFQGLLNSRLPTIGQLAVQTVYIAPDSNRYISKKEIHRENRLFPNRPAVYFRKEKDWEVLHHPKYIKIRHFTVAGIEEIKDTAIDEFSHWTPGASLSPRKVLEMENYCLIQRGLADLFTDRFEQE
jgi:glycosyltransferase involved in cell wall biosynthesis